MTQLVKWEKAKQAIIEAKSIDEVKDIRDKAEALKAYAKQHGESKEVQNDIAEIKIRAERRMGEMLKEIDRHESGDGRPLKAFHDERLSAKPKLKDIGIFTKLFCSKTY